MNKRRQTYGSSSFNPNFKGHSFHAPLIEAALREGGYPKLFALVILTGRRLNEILSITLADVRKLRERGAYYTDETAHGSGKHCLPLFRTAT